MKALICIQSCHRDRQNGRQNASRNTYLNSWDYLIPHRYVLGDNPHPVTWVLDPDELHAPCHDDYAHCPWKTQAAAAYAHAAGFDYLFHCTTDTYIVVPRLLSLVSGMGGLPQYIGHRCDEGHASGGCGYLLGREAMEVVMKADPHTGYEDLWVGAALDKAGIGLRSLPDVFVDGPPIWNEQIISCHLGRTTDGFDPKWMEQCHADYMRYCNA